MNSLAFFGLERVGYRRWRMPVVRGLISGTGALFGGAGLGAAIEVAEQETHRPVVWATAQYLSYAPEGHELELDVDEVVRGRMTSQVRVIARSEGNEILTVVGAFGDRPVPVSGQWSRMPDVPPPEDCVPRPMMDRHEGTITSRMEMLLASARPFTDFPGPDAPGGASPTSAKHAGATAISEEASGGGDAPGGASPTTAKDALGSALTEEASGGAQGDGNSALWVRFPGLSELKASGLAIVGDFVPFGIGQALGRRAGGNSLDNTLRVAQLEDCDWILADIRVHAVEHGFGHGLVHLWTQGGVLLGTASQSTMVREWKDEPPAAEELK